MAHSARAVAHEAFLSRIASARPTIRRAGRVQCARPQRGHLPREDPSGAACRRGVSPPWILYLPRPRGSERLGRGFSCSETTKSPWTPHKCGR